jgi:glycosyltransferase involved in cell wall biosynthesis
MMKNNISFFIPAFNCEATLRESVESIMEGNFSEGDELIIVNDGSTDRTETVMDEVSKKYPNRIRILKHPRNKGGGAARNTAVEHAKHDLLFCLDADNILVPGSIPRLKEFMLQSGADAASFHEVHYFIGTKNHVANKWTYKLGGFTLADLLSSHLNPGCSGNYMFTKESWLRAGGYPECSGALDTWGFAFNQLATGTKMVVMPHSFYYHRQGIESYWIRESRKGKTSLTALQLLIPHLDLISESDVDYIFSPAGRNVWFQNLDSRPIRLKGANPTTFQPVKQPMHEKTVSRQTQVFTGGGFHAAFSYPREGFGKIIWSQKMTK